MDEQNLKEKLSKIDTPAPSKTAQDQAVSLSLAAFDAKLKNNSQGSPASGRLTDIINNVRRKIMNKKYLIGGMGGAVAVCALVAVLGAPFMNAQMARIMPVKTLSDAEGVTQKNADEGAALQLKESKLAKSDDVSSGYNPEKVKKAERRELREDSNVVHAPVLSSEAASSEPQHVIEQQQRQAEQERAMALPAEAPVAKRKGSHMPVPTSSVPGSDPLDKWRNQMQAKRLEIAPGQIGGLAVPVSPPVIADSMIVNGYKDVGRDKFEDFEENTVKQVSAEPVSTFSIDVDTASYSFLRRQLNSGVLPQKDAVRIEEMINYFDYNYPAPLGGSADPFLPTIAVYDAPWKQGNKLLHIGIKGYHLQSKPKSNIVFLIDTSGSMNSPDKLPLLVNSFKMTLDSLNPDDTVGIVVYAGSAGTVLEPTKVSDKQKIIQALENLSAGGSTAGAEGIRQAYALAEQAKIKDGNNRIILATDGDFNVGITNPEELQDFVERKRGEGIYLSVLGFGQGNYNDRTMQTLAQNGNGNAAYIDTLNEARKVLVEEASSTLFTIAKDVKIQVEFNPITVAEYRLIGYETRHLNREDFNNDKVDAGEVGAGATVTAIYEITPMGAPKMLDDLRYQGKTAADKSLEGINEYAFLKMRYKRPNEDTSNLITRPITAADHSEFSKLSDDVRFAAAVAGFGQLLKGSKFAGTLTYDQVIELATGAKGADPFGYRAEFINLVRLAKSASAMEPPR